MNIGLVRDRLNCKETFTYRVTAPPGEVECGPNFNSQRSQRPQSAPPCRQFFAWKPGGQSTFCMTTKAHVTSPSDERSLKPWIDSIRVASTQKLPSSLMKGKERLSFQRRRSSVDAFRMRPRGWLVAG